jgi:SAM-dependent methyltransferase
MQKEVAELSRDPFIETEQTENGIKLTLKYLEGRLDTFMESAYGVFSNNRMLDIGRESPLTRRIKEKFQYLRIENTYGDLDVIPLGGAIKYDYILFSHTIEHLFNPLHALLQIRKVMHKASKMFIILPNKPKFLWWEGHYHEIDRYRMGLLLQRAGYRIISYERHRLWRNSGFYLKGVRPFMRLFFEHIDYYEVML